MATRSVRIPLSIKIVLGVLALVGVVRTLGAAGQLLASDGLAPNWFALVALDEAILAYGWYALSRLSRWAPILHGVTVSALIGWRYVQDPHWTDKYPMLGAFALIIPLGLYMALVLPHWRKMNWAPLGLPYKPATNPTDLF